MEHTPHLYDTLVQPSSKHPLRTCGRERVIRPHLEVVSATHVAVLDFRTGNRGKTSLQNGQKPLKNISRMPLNYRFWQTAAIAPSHPAGPRNG